MCVYESPKFSQTQRIQEKNILEKLADILAEENLLTPMEKLSLKEKINKYQGTL